MSNPNFNNNREPVFVSVYQGDDILCQRDQKRRAVIAYFASSPQCVDSDINDDESYVILKTSDSKAYIIVANNKYKDMLYVYSKQKEQKADMLWYMEVYSRHTIDHLILEVKAALEKDGVDMFHLMSKHSKEWEKSMQECNNIISNFLAPVKDKYLTR